MTNVTVGAGMIIDRNTSEQRPDHWDDQASESLHSELSSVSSVEREGRYSQKPVTILVTGLTGAGKTTISYLLERRLFDYGNAATVLDGQNMRQGISRDLGFTANERSENLRRSAEVAKLFNDAGMIVVAAFVAPQADVRQRAAEVVGRDRFLIVHLDAPLEVCRERDTDGHYPKADSGEMPNFPGVTAPYEAPENPDLIVKTDQNDPDACVDQIIALLRERAFIQ